MNKPAATLYKPSTSQPGKMLVIDVDAYFAGRQPRNKYRGVYRCSPARLASQITSDNWTLYPDKEWLTLQAAINFLTRDGWYE